LKSPNRTNQYRPKKFKILTKQIHLNQKTDPFNPKLFGLAENQTNQTV
jgi:hypothetical protein